MTGKQIIDKAKTYIGFGPTTFTKAYGVPHSTAWCCIFVWYIFKQCNASNLFFNGGKTAYCPDAMAWCRANLQRVSPAQAAEGDIVFFDWNNNNSPDHIGFIIRGGLTSCQTIEGNTNGNKVAIRQRANSTIIGIFRPKYDDDGLISINREYQVSVKSTEIRRGADNKYAVVGLLRNGAKIHTTKMTKDGKWVFKPDGTAGWVDVSDLRLMPTPITINRRYKVVSDTDIRRGANSRYKAVQHLKVGTVIHCTKMLGDWVWTDYGTTGWVHIKTSKKAYLRLMPTK